MNCTIEALSNDLLRHIVTNYLFIISCEDQIDQSPLPSEILALQLVSKRFCNLIKSFSESSLIWNALANLRNRSSCSPVAASNLMAYAARLYGSVTLIEWLTISFKFPLNEYCCNGAIRG